MHYKTGILASLICLFTSSSLRAPNLKSRIKKDFGKEGKSLFKEVAFLLELDDIRPRYKYTGPTKDTEATLTIHHTSSVTAAQMAALKQTGESCILHPMYGSAQKIVMVFIKNPNQDSEQKQD